jgi:hypothetical protein
VLLGDLIVRLSEETAAAEALLGIGDLGLLAEMRARAEENGVTLGTYAAWAVRVYADNAPPDEWTTLIGVLGRAEDPGGACLKRAFAYVLAGSG